MQHDNSVVSLVLNTINASVVANEKTWIGDYFIARTGLYGRIPSFSQPVFIGGFSCKSNLEQASRVAQFEVAERVLATYYFSDPAYRDSEYVMLAPDTNQLIGYVKPEEVLLGPTPANLTNDLDAVGLSFHTDLNLAVQHALFELIERHLLAKIWYENHGIQLISQTRIGNYIYTDYTVSNTVYVPFVMSVIYEVDDGFLCVGAAFSTSLKLAKSKARAEALMLAHDVLHNKTTALIENRNSQVKLASQANREMTQRRKSYLNTISSNNEISIDEITLSLDESIQALHIDKSALGYSILHSSPHGHLVRAMIPALKKLKDYRKTYFKTDKYQLDPIC